MILHFHFVTCRCCQNHTVKLNFQFGDWSRGANLVCAGVRICSHGVGRLLNVGVVLAAGLPAGDAEDTADAKGGGAAAGGSAPEGFALGGRVASAVVVVRGRAGVVGELHHVEDCQGLEWMKYMREDIKNNKFWTQKPKVYKKLTTNSKNLSRFFNI